jgi:hypothetical protein
LTKFHFSLGEVYLPHRLSKLMAAPGHDVALVQFVYGGEKADATPVVEHQPTAIVAMVIARCHPSPPLSLPKGASMPRHAKVVLRYRLTSKPGGVGQSVRLTEAMGRLNAQAELLHETY